MKILKKSVNLGLALGIVWGAYIFTLGLIATIWHYGVELVQLTSSMYLGYQATITGSILGGLWGFVDGFIFGFLVCLIYKSLNKCCCKGTCDICSKCGCKNCQCK